MDSSTYNSIPASAPFTQFGAFALFGPTPVPVNTPIVGSLTQFGANALLPPPMPVLLPSFGAPVTEAMPDHLSAGSPPPPTPWTAFNAAQFVNIDNQYLVESYYNRQLLFTGF